jgi:hypothetical protein
MALYKKQLKLRFYLVKDCEVLVVDALRDELKIGPQYTQASRAWEGFLGHGNNTIVVRHDLWVQLTS